VAYFRMSSLKVKLKQTKHLLRQAPANKDFPDIKNKCQSLFNTMSHISTRISNMVQT